MSHWYVVQTKPRQESLALSNLERQGYVAYCPQIRQMRRQRGKWRDTIEPLFPRYLFVELTEGEDNFSPLRSTIGVSSLLRFGDTPAHVSQQTIEVIRQQEKELLVNEGSLCKPGDIVRVLEGPLAGLKGIFYIKNREQRVIVLMDLLGTENKIIVHMNNIVPA